MLYRHDIMAELPNKPKWIEKSLSKSCPSDVSDVSIIIVIVVVVIIMLAKILKRHFRAEKVQE